MGQGAGGHLTTGDNNIDIDNSGVDGDSGTIRIGSEFQGQTFTAGIALVPVTGTAVVVDDNGQLGTVASSERFKKDIATMDKASEAVLSLWPVTFHYKSDAKDMPQFGLIAEEVAKVNPDLVVRDKGGKPYTVRYDQVNAMLLNEFLKRRTAKWRLVGSRIGFRADGMPKPCAISELAPRVMKLPGASWPMAGAASI